MLLQHDVARVEPLAHGTSCQVNLLTCVGVAAPSQYVCQVGNLFLLRELLIVLSGLRWILF